jgi:eukaryotic-like serine/threonine-protein kinase
VLEAVPPAKRKLSARVRWSWGLAGLVALIAAVVVVLILIDSSGNAPVVGNHENGASPKSNGSPVALEEATDYDPEGDGHEEPGTVELAIDGNPTGTAWTTEHYDTDTFAGTKTGPDPGVGIYVTSKAAASPKTMKILSPTPGWDAQIFAAAAGPPEEIEEWGEQVGEVNDAGKEEEVQLHLGGAAKYFLIWFTKASPASDQEGRFQVEISDIKLFE